MLADLLHHAVHALPDVILAVDAVELRILDVNRLEAFGYTRDDLGGLTLDGLVDAPRDDLLRFVAAADGRILDLGVHPKSGALLPTTARAAGSAAAASAPCVLVALREASDRATMIDEIRRVSTVVRSALASLERISARTDMSPPHETDARAPTAVRQPGPPGPAQATSPPELSLAQYASLCVESELDPGSQSAIGGRYGLPDEATRAELHRIWSDRLERDPMMRAEWTALGARYRDWLSAQQPAETSGVAQQVATPHVPLRAVGTGAASNEPRARTLPFGTDAGAPRRSPLAAIGTIGVNEEHRTGVHLPFKDAQAPDLSVDQFAALSVELEAYPDRKSEILALYGIVTEVAWRECDGIWGARLGADPALRRRWMKLAAELRTKLVRK